ncbi:MAG: class I SAM-dependent methyltransferase [Rhodobacteraceae bacterium]|nr:class I SAM-dependent methyltransferase [Paracoccaceae bacterium]
MDIQAVETSYARWAPIYDRTFGAITNRARRKSVEFVNSLGGSVLEVGVGTGMSLEFYSPDMKVTGIDFSDDMLAKAKAKVESHGFSHVKELRQMDARFLDFPDNSFDTIVAMHVVSVVPEPERVVAEMARVCKPGGTVLITNHFARDKGLLSLIERATASLPNVLGWHSDFRIERVLGESALRVVEQKPWPPFGMMTFLRMQKAK